MTDPHARSGEGPDRLEQAIDRAVADLVQVDPPPGLRRRVTSRLAAPAQSRWPRSTGYGLAVAALAALVLFVGLPGWHERSDPPRPDAAPVTASTAGTAAGDGRLDRERVKSPAVGGQRNQHARPQFGARQSLPYPALVASPRVPGSPPSLRRPSERVATERGPAMFGATLTSDAALSELLVAPDSGAAGSRARPAVRAGSEGGVPAVGGGVMRGMALEEGAAAAVVAGPELRPAPQLEIRELVVPPLEVEPLHIDPLAPTERQP